MYRFFVPGNSKTSVRLFMHKSLKGEAANYIKAMDCRQKKEILFSEMTQAQLEELDWEDDYNVYKTSFNILDYEILVEDEDLAEA